MTCKTILSENRAYWTQRSAGYSKENQIELRDAHRANWYRELSCRIFSRFPNRKPEDLHILEVGTGPGFFAIILAEAGFHVTAVDLTPSMLEEAKRNAASLAEHIDFREMNAEELAFSDCTFDCLVTRNLTWNLPHPEAAYREWCRVLKPGGLLLNYDANWYNYLFDEAAKTGYEQDRVNTADKGFRDQNVGEHFDVMEDIARRIPLSSARRPGWDQGVLEALGMQITVDTEVWQRVWSEEEQTGFASTPMFLVQAVKTV